MNLRLLDSFLQTTLQKRGATKQDFISLFLCCSKSASYCPININKVLIITLQDYNLKNPLKGFLSFSDCRSFLDHRMALFSVPRGLQKECFKNAIEKVFCFFFVFFVAVIPAFNT